MSVYRRCTCGLFESWGTTDAPPTTKCRTCGTVPAEVSSRLNAPTSKPEPVAKPAPRRKKVR